MPPSWSTSLASAGFTEEEISRIHARREMGVRSPPDLRYLYNERPRSPAATAAFPPGYANPNQPPQPFGLPATPAPGPVLTHPTPRTTSLPRGATPVDQPPNTQQKPVLPSLQTTKPTLPANPAALSNPVKIAGASTAVATPTSLVLGAGDPRRAPPPKPKRKAPSPYEPYDAEGTTRVNQHRQNQPSSSTVGASTSDSHGYGSGYDASGWVFSFLFRLLDLRAFEGLCLFLPLMMGYSESSIMLLFFSFFFGSPFALTLSFANLTPIIALLPHMSSFRLFLFLIALFCQSLFHDMF